MLKGVLESCIVGRDALSKVPLAFCGFGKLPLGLSVGRVAVARFRLQKPRARYLHANCLFANHAPAAVPCAVFGGQVVVPPQYSAAHLLNFQVAECSWV